MLKRQTLKMYNFSYSLPIYLKFSSDITHYKIFECKKFCGCSLKAEVDLALKTVKKGV